MPMIDPPAGCPAVGEVIKIGRWKSVSDLTVDGMSARVDGYRLMSDGESVWCEMTLTETAYMNDGEPFTAWTEKVR